MGPGELTDHAQRNRAHWTGLATSYAEAARRAWQREPNWGCWGSPDSELHLLDDVSGKDVLELGCGTAYISFWLARQGARVDRVGHGSPAQLETARRMQAEFGIEFELVEASAESIPSPDESFDLVVSEFGASIWCDPYLWVPEAARVLRPGGRLVFLVNGVISMLCYPGQARSRRDGVAPPLLRYAPRRVVIRGLGGVPPAARRLDPSAAIEWLDVLDLVELQAPEGAPDPTFDYATTEWARKWPAEEITQALLAAVCVVAVVVPDATPGASALGIELVASGLRQPCTWQPRRVSRNGSTSSSVRDASALSMRDACFRDRSSTSAVLLLRRPRRSALDRLPPPLPDRPPRLRHVHGTGWEPRRARASCPTEPRTPESGSFSACECRRASTRTWAASSRSALADDCTRGSATGSNPQRPRSRARWARSCAGRRPAAGPARSRGDRPAQSVAVLLRPTHRRSAIGDVGERAFEEVNVIRRGHAGSELRLGVP